MVYDQENTQQTFLKIHLVLPSGIGRLRSCGSSHLRSSLATSPLGALLPSPGGLLLSGPRGVGKSSLGRLLLRDMARHPDVSAYVTVVDCKTYRGTLWNSPGVRCGLVRLYSGTLWNSMDFYVGTL